MRSLNFEDFNDLRNNGFEVVDFRQPDEFVNGFIPNSFYIDPYDEHALTIFEHFVKPFNKLIAIFSATQSESPAESLQQIDSAGIAGYLQGGFDAWRHNHGEYEMLITIDPDEFELDVKHDQNLQIMDIRSTDDFNAIHLEGSVNAPLHQIPILVSELQPEEKFYLLSTNKSTAIAAAAYLNRHGITLLRILDASFTQLRKTSLPFAQEKLRRSTRSNSGNGQRN